MVRGWVRVKVRVRALSKIGPNVTFPGTTQQVRSQSQRQTV